MKKTVLSITIALIFLNNAIGQVIQDMVLLPAMMHIPGYNSLCLKHKGHVPPSDHVFYNDGFTVKGNYSPLHLDVSGEYFGKSALYLPAIKGGKINEQHKTFVNSRISHYEENFKNPPTDDILAKEKYYEERARDYELLQWEAWKHEEFMTTGSDINTIYNKSIIEAANQVNFTEIKLKNPSYLNEAEINERNLDKMLKYRSGTIVPNSNHSKHWLQTKDSKTQKYQMIPLENGHTDIIKFRKNITIIMA
jgi:hypothetical protein